MNESKTINDLTSEIDFQVLKTADREMFDVYNLGKNTLRKAFTNDIEFLQGYLRAFFEYYATRIALLPEVERTTEHIKLRLVQDQLDSIIKTLNFDKNILDKNLFLFYTLAYVNDIVRKHGSRS